MHFRYTCYMARNKKRPRKPARSSSSSYSERPPHEGAGRPPYKFTKKQMDKIAEMAFDQCHTHTIAQVIGVSDETITENLSKFLKSKRAEGRAALHHKQVQAALEGENTMLVWLGKNALDQTDRQQIDTNQNIKLYDTASPIEDV